MKPILIDFPNEFYTDRLLIRRPDPGDGKVVFNAIQASIQELKPWMEFAQKQQTEEDLEVFMREAHTNFINREDLHLLVFDRKTGDFIASSGLHRINWSIPKFEIGYWIDSRKSGKGYMTETVEGITNFAFETLKARRVEIRCDSDNERSRRVAERLDFPLEGILKNSARSMDKSGLKDTCIFAKVR
ncbi:GNAT family N-acetyltransferase [Bacillus carboniphilus]|uniref:GNAT family N-acetyltransferase n=1 Tax=Bacillus carboniphilus TaxID=86663 RepID=A0ABY9JS00_9BACI|nr:GNAT family N-acetyltransferase [Bacillus carboniphilus]WLR42186.1 GNAT family N-acetyltransferase [Bacillus carboniphilus]